MDSLRLSVFNDSSGCVVDNIRRCRHSCSDSTTGSAHNQPQAVHSSWSHGVKLTLCQIFGARRLVSEWLADGIRDTVEHDKQIRSGKRTDIARRPVHCITLEEQSRTSRSSRCRHTTLVDQHGHGVSGGYAILLFSQTLLKMVFWSLSCAANKHLVGAGDNNEWTVKRVRFSQA